MVKLIENAWIYFSIILSDILQDLSSGTYTLDFFHFRMRIGNVKDIKFYLESSDA